MRSLRLRRPLLCAALWACASAAQATTLVAVWTPERLLIGADSRVVTNQPDLNLTACKISQKGSTFYAVSGLVEDQAAHYNVGALAQQAIDSENGMTDQLARFVAVTRPALSKALAGVRAEAPEQYRFLQEGHPVLQAIFAEVEPDGAPYLAVVGFQLDPAGELTDFTKVIAEGDDHRGPRIIYAGQQQKIRDYLRGHRDWSSGDSTQLVRTLISLEINNGSGQVGAPIDILSLTPGAARWVQKKPECSEVLALPLTARASGSPTGDR